MCVCVQCRRSLFVIYWFVGRRRRHRRRHIMCVFYISRSKMDRWMGLVSCVLFYTALALYSYHLSSLSFTIFLLFLLFLLLLLFPIFGFRFLFPTINNINRTCLLYIIYMHICTHAATAYHTRLDSEIGLAQISWIGGGGGCFCSCSTTTPAATATTAGTATATGAATPIFTTEEAEAGGSSSSQPPPPPPPPR